MVRKRLPICLFRIIQISTFAVLLYACNPKELFSPIEIEFTTHGEDTLLQPGVTKCRLTAVVTSVAPLHEITVTRMADGKQDLEGEKIRMFYPTEREHLIEMDLSGILSETIFRINAVNTRKHEFSTEFKVRLSMPPGKPLHVWKNRELGAHLNVTVGQYFASTDGEIRTKSQAQGNQSLIDFVYGYPQADSATLFAPDDQGVGSGNENLNLCHGWTTKNSTRFIPRDISPAVYASTTHDAAVKGETGHSLSKITKLKEGEIYGFITQAGKKGWLKIGTIIPGEKGSIRFEVSVEQN